MSERKSKRGSENVVEISSEEATFIVEPTNVEIGSGYTLAVSYDEEDRPIVDVKTFGQVDMAQLRKDIARYFPNAEIRKLNQTRSVTIVKADKGKIRKKKK